MKPVTFTVPGEPVPQPRPRVTRKGWAYYDPKHPVHAYRAAIAEEAAKAGLEDTGEPVEVIVDAVFERPKSHMTRKGIKPSAPALPRPDVDNLGKAVLDALQDVMGDDTKVRRLVVEKSYGNEARTTVRIQ